MGWVNVGRWRPPSSSSPSTPTDAYVSKVLNVHEDIDLEQVWCHIEAHLLQQERYDDPERVGRHLSGQHRSTPIQSPILPDDTSIGNDPIGNALLDRGYAPSSQHSAARMRYQFGAPLVILRGSEWSR